MTDLDKIARELLAAEYERGGIKGVATALRSGMGLSRDRRKALAAIVAALRAAPEGFVLVPVDPTPEMVKAAEEAYMPFGDMELAIQMAIAATPREVKDGAVAAMVLCANSQPQVTPQGWEQYWDGTPAAPGIDRCSLLDIVAWWNAYAGPVDEALGEVIRRIRALIDASPKAGSEAVDADEEHCESCSPECGPVEHWDSEAVPLCAKCWAELQSAGHGAGVE